MRYTSAPTEPWEVSEKGLAALEALANEHRLKILRTLAEANDPLSFSELRRRIGLADAGRFNYHLTELLDLFVRDTGSGYDLDHAGERAVVAAADLDPEGAAMAAETSTDDECPVCGEPECGKLVHVHLASR